MIVKKQVSKLALTVGGLSVEHVLVSQNEGCIASGQSGDHYCVLRNHKGFDRRVTLTIESEPDLPDFALNSDNVELGGPGRLEILDRVLFRRRPGRAGSVPWPTARALNSGAPRQEIAFRISVAVSHGKSPFTFVDEGIDNVPIRLT
jgi:hypothetical protein